MAAGWKIAAAAGIVLGLAATHPGLIPGRDSHSAVASNVALGRRLAAQDYDWTGREWQCLDTLWRGESGWRQNADTRRTHLDAAAAAVFAYGIPQARPVTKMPRQAWPAAMGGQSDPRTQITWGLRYISLNYGSPCVALAAKHANGNQGY